MMSPLRVTMIIHGYYPHLGGAERILGAIAPRLQEQGVEVSILTRCHPGFLPFEIIDGVPVYRLPIPGPKAIAAFSFILTALLRLRELRPHIIHAHEMLSATTTAITAKYLWKTPVVVTVHRGGDWGEVNRLKQKLLGHYRLALFKEKVDSFISISREIDIELAGIGVPVDRRYFLPNAVDVDYFAPLLPEEKKALRRKLGLPDVPIVIFTGRLAPEKRVNHLINIWPSVRAVYPDAHLLILGSGKEETSLKQMAGEGVQFFGHIKDVAPYLQTADLFVLPSVSEGLPVALLEAMSTGLTVAVTGVGGNLDVVKHNENGWLLPSDDIPALREAVITLLGNRNLRTNLGQKGRELVVDSYSLPTVVTRLKAFYDKILSNSNN